MESMNTHLEDGTTGEAPDDLDTPPQVLSRVINSLPCKDSGQSDARSAFKGLMSPTEAIATTSATPVSDESAVDLEEPIRLSIAELFEFSRDHWVDAVKRRGHRTLQDELELYGLLDLDADGDVDDEFAEDVSM